MKKLDLAIGFTIFSLGIASAQKYGYVDSQYILNNIPEYKTSQQQLDNMSITWQKEIEAKYSEIDKMYKAFQAEQILLTEEMKKKREDEIIAKERDAKELQKQRFGVDGDLFKKRQEMIKPIQDKIYNAIKTYAEKGAYSVIFDKSSDLTMLYATPKLDKSDDILLLMGYKKGSAAGASGGSKEGTGAAGGTGGGAAGTGSTKSK